MDKLHCPFTWEVEPLDEVDANRLRDQLPLAVRPWDLIIKKTQLAFSEFCRGNFDLSRSYMVECYMSLLNEECPGVGIGCDLTRTYRQALRHILDSTWIFLQSFHCKDRHSLDEIPAFIRKINSFESIGSKQQAAIHAFHSHFVPYPANHIWARRATELDPEEGQWHYYVASMLLDADEGYKSEDDEREREKIFTDILKFNSNCLTLRRDAPEPFLLMAKLCIGDEKSTNNSYMLVQNAIKKFPDCAYVYDQAADILKITQDSFSFLPKSYFLIDPFYKKALKIGGECLYVRYKLGFHLVCLSKLRIENYEGAYDEGMENLRKAAHLLPEAREALNRFEVKEAPIPEARNAQEKLEYQAKIVAAFPELFNIEPLDSDTESSPSSSKKDKRKKRKN